MRTIEYTPRSTPTYLFQITDQDNSGISLDDMSVGMVIYDNDGTGIYRYILPAYHAGELLTAFISSAGAGAPVIVQYKNDAYSRRINETTFAITVPYSLNLITDECPFQVFLFSLNRVGKESFNSEEGVVVSPSIVGYRAILIDEGTIQKKTSYLPTLDTAKRQGEIIV